MSDSSEVTEEFEKRIAQVSRYDFVQKHVYSSLPENGGSSIRPGDFEVLTVQNDGTGPATLEYRIRGSTGLFAKLYRDESGAHAYEVLRKLRYGDFGRDQRYQVSEPLRFVAEYNLLLTRAAPGESLASFASQDPDKALSGVKEAAKWLAKLHSSAIRIGKVDGPWYMFHKLSTGLSKAVSSHPQELKRLTATLDQLSEQAEGPEKWEMVQTHGQFRPVHVFLTTETVTVIDLDRSLPSDPAKDLAEFVHRLRSAAFHTSGRMNQANLLTKAFLDEYRDRRPSGLEHLSFYHCFHIFISQSHWMKRLKTDDPEWDPMMDFYSREFEDAASGKFLC